MDTEPLSNEYPAECDAGAKLVEQTEGKLSLLSSVNVPSLTSPLAPPVWPLSAPSSTAASVSDERCIWDRVCALAQKSKSTVS